MKTIAARNKKLLFMLSRSYIYNTKHTRTRKTRARAQYATRGHAGVAGAVVGANGLYKKYTI